MKKYLLLFLIFAPNVVFGQILFPLSNILEWYETGDRPTQQEFQDAWEHSYNTVSDGMFDLTGGISISINPYTTGSFAQSDPVFYRLSGEPLGTTSLKYNGYFHATKLFIGNTDIETLLSGSSYFSDNSEFPGGEWIKSDFSGGLSLGGLDDIGYKLRVFGNTRIGDIVFDVAEGDLEIPRTGRLLLSSTDNGQTGSIYYDEGTNDLYFQGGIGQGYSLEDLASGSGSSIFSESGPILPNHAYYSGTIALGSIAPGRAVFTHSVDQTYLTPVLSTPSIRSYFAEIDDIVTTGTQYFNNSGTVYVKNEFGDLRFTDASGSVLLSDLTNGSSSFFYSTNSNNIIADGGRRLLVGATSDPTNQSNIYAQAIGAEAYFASAAIFLAGHQFNSAANTASGISTGGSSSIPTAAGVVDYIGQYLILSGDTLSSGSNILRVGGTSTEKLSTNGNIHVTNSNSRVFFGDKDTYIGQSLDDQYQLSVGGASIYTADTSKITIPRADIDSLFATYKIVLPDGYEIMDSTDLGGTGAAGITQIDSSSVVDTLNLDASPEYAVTWDRVDKRFKVSEIVDDSNILESDTIKATNVFQIGDSTFTASDFDFDSGGGGISEIDSSTLVSYLTEAFNPTHAVVYNTATKRFEMSPYIDATTKFATDTIIANDIFQIGSTQYNEADFAGFSSGVSGTVDLSNATNGALLHELNDTIGYSSAFGIDGDSLKIGGDNNAAILNEPAWYDNPIYTVGNKNTGVGGNTNGVSFITNGSEKIRVGNNSVVFYDDVVFFGATISGLSSLQSDVAIVEDSISVGGVYYDSTDFAGFGSGGGGGISEIDSSTLVSYLTEASNPTHAVVYNTGTKRFEVSGTTDVSNILESDTIKATSIFQIGDSTFTASDFDFGGGGGSVDLSNITTDKITFTKDSSAITGAHTIDLSGNSVINRTLTGNVTLDYSGATSGTYIIVLTQDATGGRTVSWTASKWQAEGGIITIDTSANGRTVLSCFYDTSVDKMVATEIQNLSDL